MTTLPTWAERLLRKELTSAINGCAFDESAARKLLALLAPQRKNEKQKKTIRRKSEGSLRSRERSAELRAAVLTRVVDQGQQCECGCGRSLPVWGGELDHWSGGSGRRKAEESAATCWMLTLKCHAMRTRNSPSAAFWNEKRRAFCERYGYAFTPHVIHAQLPRRAAR